MNLIIPLTKFPGLTHPVFRPKTTLSKENYKKYENFIKPTKKIQIMSKNNFKIVFIPFFAFHFNFLVEIKRRKEHNFNSETINCNKENRNQV